MDSENVWKCWIPIHSSKLDEGSVYGVCLMPLLSTACGLSFVFSSSFRFIAWITAISLASFFWFRASNSNLNQTMGVTEHKTNFLIQHKPNSVRSFHSEKTRVEEYTRHIFCQCWQVLCSSHLFLIILCTIASVVRLFPLSTVRSIPFLLGSCVWWKHHKMSSIYHLSGLHSCKEIASA